MSTVRCAPGVWAGLVTWMLLGGAGSRSSVGAPPEQAREAAEVFFEKEIRPLLVKHCYACHSEHEEAREGELVLDRRQGWLEGGWSGPAVEPGQVDASLLIRAVRYDDPVLQMPPVKRLEPHEVARLEQWVRMGAPGPEQVTLQLDDDPADPVAGREHWAFRPLDVAAPPRVTTSGSSRDPIDAFIAEGLADAGLQAVPAAPREVLVRRLFFVLTGLPPTPDQLEAFLADADPQAYRRLVDSLLASPHFGERWGRHWMDLARYADSNGLDENFLFREAWRYRNWVIQAVNSDMPYDRFLLLQLAGDLLPYDSPPQRDWQRLAAGFLVIGPKVLLGNDPQNQRMEVADEQLDTIGRVVLGQTLGCARCHDHKFDPVPTADYYALAGILTSTGVMQRRYMLGEQRVMEQLVGLGEDGQQLNEAYEAYWRGRSTLGERKKRAEAALERLQQEEAADLADLTDQDAEAVAVGAQDAERPLAERQAAQQELVDRLKRAWDHPPAIPPRGMIPSEVKEPGDEAIRVAGQFDQLGEQVPRGFLQVLWDGPPADIPEGESGRRQLAQWLTDPQQRSGQLAARVLANRLWQRVMGQGLVPTVDNFGRTGQRPSHPELLDYLAQQLLDNDWSVKAVLRQLVMSQTFRRGVSYQEAGERIDPENRWWWRAHRRRLDPEAMRDAMLLAADMLDRTPMDSSVWYLGDQATAVGPNPFRRRTDFPCRSVYLPVIRNDLPELFEIFDFADPHATTGQRPDTNLPTQGLFMLNDEQVMEVAERIASRIVAGAPAAEPADWLAEAFAWIVQARPTEAEVEMLERAMRRFETLAAGDADRPASEIGLTLVCHSLLASSRFQYLE